MREDYFNNLDHYLSHVKRRQRQWQWFLNISTFIIVAWFTYSFINYPALQARTIYAFAEPKETNTSLTSNNTDITSEENGAINESGTNTTESDNAIEQGDAHATGPVYHEAEGVPDDVPGSGIYIQKIDIKAPINWEGTSDNVKNLLATGVVHIAGSASPGSPGNVFITGHSSDYWWTAGDYKTVFSLLDKLENGDEIVVRYKGYDFLYKVYNKEVINKEDIGKFVTNDKTQSLTLMTCHPVGTDWQRLIIQAERI